MPFTTLRLAFDGPVARLHLTRPDVHNAFDDVFISEMNEALGQLAGRSDVRIVVLAGEGKSFCAGADLNWMKRALGYTRDENRRDARAMAEMFRRLCELPQAVVARVHGAAIGGGVGLVACCDIAIASDAAKFGLAEVKLGILPAVISPFVIGKIGAGAAREYFLTGARFDAAEARRIGLVNRVVTAEKLDEAVDGIANDLLTSGPEAIAHTKQLIRFVANATMDAALDHAVEAICERRTSREGQEGMNAFLEKRKADWIPER